MGFDQVRSRKEALVPLSNGLEEFKIEIVEMGSYEEFSSMLNMNVVEVVTSPGPVVQEVQIEGVRPRKRAKLDHLSPDQKTQHRKMMNRMSAQSARDRQRSLMQQQEAELCETRATVSCNLLQDQSLFWIFGEFLLIIDFPIQNAVLKEENKKLKASYEALEAENRELKAKAEETEKLKAMVEKLTLELSSRVAAEIREAESVIENHVIIKEESCNSMEPAVPSTVPLPKGLETQLIFLCTLLIWEHCFQWTSTLPNFSKLLKTSQNKFSVKTAMSLLSNK